MNHPTVSWAQRKDLLYLTIGVDDCKNAELKVEDSKLYFKGTGGADKRDYEVTIEFFSDINAEKARRTPSDRVIQYVLPKKEAGPFWPRLLKQEKKVAWVKVDFEKWKDEDESDDEWAKGAGAGGGGGQFDMNSMMQNMGGGYPGGPANLDDFDSDEEDLPDLEDGSADKSHEEVKPSVSGTKAEEEEEEGKKEEKVTTEEVTAS